MQWVDLGVDVIHDGVQILPDEEEVIVYHNIAWMGEFGVEDLGRELG